MKICNKEELNKLEKKKLFEQATTLGNVIGTYEDFLYDLNREVNTDIFNFKCKMKEYAINGIKKVIEETNMRKMLGETITYCDIPIEYDIDVDFDFDFNDNIISIIFQLCYTNDYHKDTYYGFKHGEIVKINIPENNNIDDLKYEVEIVDDPLTHSYYKEEKEVIDFFYKNKKLVLELYKTCIKEPKISKETKENIESKAMELETVFSIELTSDIYAICEMKRYYDIYRVYVTKIFNIKTGEIIVNLDRDMPNKISRIKVDQDKLPNYIDERYPMDIEKVYEKYKEYQLKR